MASMQWQKTLELSISTTSRVTSWVALAVFGRKAVLADASNMLNDSGEMQSRQNTFLQDDTNGTR
jgi:hypothetical protein